MRFTSNSSTFTRHPGRWKTLHLAWMAFFLTFVVWFNLGAFKTTIGRALHLTEAQLNTLLICNVALTIPTRIAIGMLVDRFGPRRVYSGLMLFALFPCLACALAHNYMQLVISRLLISCVGAGFVVGIRLVGEWFDASEIGWAEGIYGGLGNFGMAAATFGLPVLALAFGGANGWRWAMAISGVLCAIYSVVFYRTVSDAPAGETFRRPKRASALLVNSRAELASLILMQVPMVLCLGVLTWRLMKVNLFGAPVGYVIYAMLGLLLLQQAIKILRVNRGVIAGEPNDSADQYSFMQVAILALCYAVTFGGELAIESMLPGYFEKMFSVSVTLAGVMGAGFAFASLIARPLGGWMGDRVGRKPIMIVSLAGSVLGIVAIKSIGPSLPLSAAMAIVIGAGFFLMAGNGANFCIAPLIHKPMTGQIAGLIGAYGNVGSVIFLLVLTLAGPQVFFLSITCMAVLAFITCFLLREPSRSPSPKSIANLVESDSTGLAIELA